MKKMWLAAIAILATTVNLLAGLTLPTIFSDHMVLQQGQEAPVWGSATPGSQINVQFAGQEKKASADAEGKWRVKLDPMQASADPRTLTITSSQDGKVEIKDVLIGEVWLCAGQSNMEMPMKGFEKPLVNGPRDIAAATIPTLRLYRTPRAAAAVPKARIDAEWTVCTPETVKDFSAVAFYFGQKLQEDLDVPVGLWQSAWGGTRIEPWIPPCGYEGIDSLAKFRDQIKKISPDLGKNPKKIRRDRQIPTAIFNGMLQPNVPFAIKGVIWYQGESNYVQDARAHNPMMLYVDKSKALLKGWRSLWGYDFPFYFVQIAPFKYYGDNDATFLPQFWEAQAEIVKEIPKTGMAVVSDATTLNDIHPTNKEVPGKRLALLALDNTYGKDLVSTGPTFKKIKKPLFGGNTLKVVFKSAAGLTTRDGKAPDWFEIAGEDGIWKAANAVIKGDSVILSSPDVQNPVAVRFAWSNLATPNLVNGAGLPTPAFRAGKLPEK